MTIKTLNPTAKTLFILVSLITIHKYSVAQTEPNYYKINGNTVMQIGYGLTKSDFNYAPPLQGLTYVLDTSSKAATSFNLQSKIVFDESSLRDILNIDTKISARYLTYSASASANIDLSSVHEENSITIVLHAENNYGTVVLKNPKLTDDALHLLHAIPSQTDLFIKNYGTHFVDRIERGSFVNVLISVKNVSSDVQSKVGVHVTGSMDVGAVSGSMDLSVYKELAQASKEGRITIQINGQGGQGTEGLSDIVKNLIPQEDNLPKIISALGDYVKTFNEKNSVPIACYTASYSDLDQAFHFDDIWTTERETMLADIVYEYRRLSSYKDQFGLILDQSDNKYLLLDGLKIADMQDLTDKIKKNMLILSVNYNQVKGGADLSTIKSPQKLVISDGLIPAFPRFFINDGRSNDRRDTDDMGWGSLSKVFNCLTLYSDLNTFNSFKTIKTMLIYAKNSINNDQTTILNLSDIINPFAIIPDKFERNIYSSSFLRVAPVIMSKILNYESPLYKSLKNDNSYVTCTYYLSITDYFGHQTDIKLFDHNTQSNPSYPSSPLNGITPYNLNTNCDFEHFKIFIRVDPTVAAVSDTLYLSILPKISGSQDMKSIVDAFNSGYYRLVQQIVNYPSIGNHQYSINELQKNGNVIYFDIPQILPAQKVIIYWSFKKSDFSVDSSFNVTQCEYKQEIPLTKRIGGITVETF